MPFVHLPPSTLHLRLHVAEHYCRCDINGMGDDAFKTNQAEYYFHSRRRYVVDNRVLQQTMAKLSKGGRGGRLLGREV